MKARFSLVFCIVVSITVVPVFAADWPQWRGPDRTGVSNEKGLLATWPKGGPALAWTFDKAGLGFSSPSVVGDRLYLTGARNEKTYLFCLDISGKTPKELWHYEMGAIFTFNGNVWGDGPRSSPTVDGKHVYALTGSGDLACVTSEGKKVWSKNLITDFGGRMMTEWGYSESVLIDGDKLICMPGSKSGSIVALNKITGATVWKSDLSDMASYGSIVAAEIGGVRQYIAMTYVSETKGAAVAGVSAKDGKTLWYYHPGNYAKSSFAVAATPIVTGDEVYVSAGYGAGCRLLKVTGKDGKFEVNNTYTRRAYKVMKNGHGGVVRIGDHLYGHSERSGFVCQNWKTGKEIWFDRAGKLPCTSGSLIAADGHLYLYSDEGVAVLIEATPKGWNEKGRLTIPKLSQTPKTRPTSQYSKIWAHPVLANGKLYLRDQEYLHCFDVRAK